MINFYMFSSVMFIIGLLFFIMKSNYLLLMLLSLEFLVISLYFNMGLVLSFNLSDYFFLMMFLTVSVCEGALGLAMLVLMIRSYGNDYLNSMLLLW
ncbi:NADH dehydrogenase subunit 4L (mitochondrion) [Cylas formicarius]|uniref:NADH-ubiquinone oxidoreductase chain 4L n=2 Tax=Cylas formicarius TaxID=197179 RepID=A0A6G6C6I3_CYLFO|nr:NADH dehydrogenase subunit 4L [Cylas formicarius]QID76644.1 NADH dehydrogenase subunit 4L [Cylas formicarius]WGU49406.1 NADH dehydrogenase subunit 4L [Cylas formicarius]WGU49419.1 NADH dehydrogenase subunit 4L [Cylas formicarius]WGU49432.1 NADH dehydrogenase subunit 4L [Cylas formicarius]WGU49445.1 NADH dehydrogenase subunit 4L [Cylas formicarius]